MSAKQTEAQIQAAGIKFLRDLGCICIKLAVSGSFGTRGWPDYLVLADPGLTFFLEFKTPKGNLTALQKNALRKLFDVGHHVHVVRSKQDVIDFYAKYIHEPRKGRK